MPFRATYHPLGNLCLGATTSAEIIAYIGGIAAAYW